MNTNLNPRQREGRRTDSRSRRRGIMLILFALLLAPLLALIGLAIDGGHVYFEKRRMQAAADGGAFGAAREIFRGNDDRVVSGGREDATLNGYDNALSDITVTVNRPPSSGPNSGNNNAVEVIIERPVATTFMKVITQQDTTVRARAVAGMVLEWDPPCVLALDEDASGAITVSGTTDINLPDCTIIAVSDDPQALTINGGVNINSGGMGFGATSNGYVQNGQGTVTPWPPLPAPGAEDPYYPLPEPLLPYLPELSNSKLQISTDRILDPGYYRGGIKITGGNVQLAAGLFIVDGLEVTGGNFGNLDPVTQNGGVTIFNTGAGQNDNIHIGGNVVVDLHATYSGVYKNILFFNSYSAATNNGATSDATLLGTSDSTYDGVMYFPTVKLNYGGSSTQDGTFAMIIANTIELSGTPQLGPDWAGANRTPSLSQVSLLE